MVQTRLIPFPYPMSASGIAGPAVRADATICPAFSDISDVMNRAVFRITARSL
jgi:hypothetical protein